jgi:hypothetical protein
LKRLSQSGLIKSRTNHFDFDTINKKDIDNIEISDAYPWVQQESINAEAICNSIYVWYVSMLINI